MNLRKISLVFFYIKLAIITYCGIVLILDINDIKDIFSNNQLTGFFLLIYILLSLQRGKERYE